MERQIKIVFPGEPVQTTLDLPPDDPKDTEKEWIEDWSDCTFLNH